ncbi:methyl-accepting chemotaxis protein [Paraburkholderia sp. BL25I1N1]|uniref:methyl-accepting chemotaxis protein n=1 Tax=Paraburkholderia sp. BL25I1N1 TaxID=1938804 RepID=UPI000D08289B|nr:methyl-accepting chemotaxis protein [Paraburkholderia sp. BL25I1N1]PRY06628.1 methyl-accepting chemotaxis protein [Paraburkholderia sp. BL25I1N1]
MKRMTVGRKLGAAFGIVVLVSLIGSTISIINFFGLNQADGWNIHSYQVLRANDDMLTSLINMETGVRGYVASGDERFLEPYQAGIGQFGKSFDLLHSLTSDNASQQQRLDTLRAMQQKVHEVDEKLIALRRDVNAGTQPANALVDYFKQANDKQFMDRYRAVAGELNQAEQALLDQRTGEVSRLTASTRLTLATTGVITIVLAVLLGFVITRAITRALGGEPAEAAHAAGRIAEGKLDEPVTVAPNDRGSLMASLESMRRQLRSIVSEIQSSAEAIGTSAGEIAQGNLDLSQRTEEQAASLQETAASMEELTATVRQNTENAKQANSLAGNACDVAVLGGKVVGEVVESMGAISESSGKVAEIIAVIEGIAFQTNILALNAAVEAARAGEQGRGFAVVAGEVRTLAQRSAAAAKEIKDLITSSVGRVAEGSEQVRRAGTTMSEIVKSIRQVTDIMGEIASASDEQGTGIEQVNVAVGQMDAVTQQNAALVEEASAAAQAMAGQASTLRDAVAVFRV